MTTATVAPAASDSTSRKETLQFSADENLIFHVFSSQAGTLAKALLEAAMNSIDAGAGKCIVNLSATEFNITDDGKGITSRTQIDEWFAKVGTPHVEGDAVYGKFRMGRGQLFSFAATTWRTGPFKMDVDIKARRKFFDLETLRRVAKGCRINGRLYTPLSQSELDEVANEFVDLVRYAPIPVSLNGRANKDPRTQRWDLETEDAYIKISATSEELKVYNLGVGVRSYPAHENGCAGVVVSRRALKVNFARNDILTHQCEVWARIRASLKAQNIVKISSKDTLTRTDRDFLARQLAYGDVPAGALDRVRRAKLITDAGGRHHAIEDLSRFKHITVATDAQSRMGVKLQSSGDVLVLDEATLNRFNCSSVRGFLQEIRSSARAAWLPAELDFGRATEKYSNELRAIDELELTGPEQCALDALRDVHPQFHRWFARGEKSFAARSLRAGMSDIAAGWTDGATSIYIERKILESAAKHGAEGFFEALMLLVHEYCHDTSDHGSHTHDQVFFSRHHDVVQHRSGRLVTLTARCVKVFEARMKTVARP